MSFRGATYDAMAVCASLCECEEAARGQRMGATYSARAAERGASARAIADRDGAHCSARAAAH